jgi:hypothetical protein
MVFIGKPDRLLADHFGFLQKETKVTKPNFRLTSCPSFSSLSSVQNFEFKQRFLSAVIPSVASCKIRCRFGCGVAALSDA